MPTKPLKKISPARLLKIRLAYEELHGRLHDATRRNKSLAREVVQLKARLAFRDRPRTRDVIARRTRVLTALEEMQRTFLSILEEVEMNLDEFEGIGEQAEARG